MARRSRKSLLDDVQADRLSDAPSECESDKSGNVMMTTMSLGPQHHRKAEKGWGYMRVIQM
jgi:hypothetical protein